MDSHFGFAWS